MQHNPNHKRPAAVQRGPLDELLTILGQRQGSARGRTPDPEPGACPKIAIRRWGNDALKVPLIRCAHRVSSPKGLSFFSLEKLVEFVRNLIREEHHRAVGVNALRVGPNNACHLRRGDHYPRWFPILPPAQVQYLLGEYFLRLQRQIGTQDIQTCPYSFNTLACGKFDSGLCLGALAAVLLRRRIKARTAAAP